jgi:hypothetical protein
MPHQVVRSLFTAHSRPLTVLYSDLENHAGGLPEVFPGTAGSVIERTNASGFRFYARQYYDGEGAKRERYLAGPIGDATADAAAEGMRARIREIKELVPALRMLGREGFSVVDPRTYATLAVVHNAGIFRAGGMLVGSHAYGVMLNRMGVRAAPYATEDIDIARRERLAVQNVPEGGFLDVLRSSGLEFIEVPAFERGQPSTSFKQRGRSRFHVDLLAPSAGETFPTVAVPELHAFATGLPYLAFLLAESQTSVLLGREGCFAVRVPVPERFAVHKLIVSQVRPGADAKAERDVVQACTLAAAVADVQPGALEAAVAHIPPRARKHFSKALPAARRWLTPNHPRAWEELDRR